MERLNSNPRNWAYLMIVGGLVLLAAQIGWLGRLSDSLWAGLFLVAGAAFIYQNVADRRYWWALIPGSALGGVGLVFLRDEVGGAYFLAALGLGFAAVFLTARVRWWAIIPAGTLLTLALVAWFDVRTPGVDTGWLFFLGLAATFGLLYFLPDSQRRQTWAIYPALASLALFAITVLSEGVTGVVMPIVLIVVGAYLLWRRGSSPRGPTLPHGGA